MKRWGLVIVALYGVVITVLTVPLALVLFCDSEIPLQAATIVHIYREACYWAFVGVMVLGSALLLFIPVSTSVRPLKTRRPLIVPVITTAFFMAALLAGVVSSIMVGLRGDHALNAIDKDPFLSLSIVLLSVTLIWMLWGVLFYLRSRGDNRDTLVKRATAWLLRGSILELLVAVPCHVIARRRDDCCASGVTAIGIALGLCIMLMSFGPGVFFLFVERSRRLKAKGVPPAPLPDAPPPPEPPPMEEVQG